MSTSTHPGKEKSSQPDTPAQQDDQSELDGALKDSFPASDPPGVTPGADPQNGEEDALDEALEESFPASDPPSPVQPGEK